VSIADLKGTAMHIAAVTRRRLAKVLAAGALTLAAGALTTGFAVTAAGATGSGTSPDLSVRPDSANTCGGPVCIFVTGSGLNVSDWATTVNLPRTMCSYANFLVNGVLVATGQYTCGTVGENLGSDWSNPGNFANGTQLCNTWAGISGEACITVHS
jgi:hypothetical protein